MAERLWLELSSFSTLLQDELRLGMRSLSSRPGPSEKRASYESRQPYRYETLDKQKRQIRLFQLLPDRKDEELRGRLTTVDLDNGPDYDALSYTWGDPRHCFTLIVDDDQFLEITESLRNALIGLRDEHDSRTFWVDAICINQSHVVERNHQVQSMFDIYQNAQTVRTWLGREHEEWDNALRDEIASCTDAQPMERENLHSSSRIIWHLQRLINTFGTVNLLTETEEDNLSGILDNPMFATMKASFDDSTGRQAWGDLSVLASRPYWSRAWIQQEIATEKNVTVHWGQLSFSLTSLYYTFQALNRYLAICDVRETSSFQKLIHLRYNNIYPHQTLRENLDRDDYHALCTILIRQSLVRATNPKDKVYGMVGICRPWRNSLTIDYRLPTHRVYVAAFKSVVTRYNHLNLMVDLVRPPDLNRLEGLPSWCPDLSTDISFEATIDSPTSPQEWSAFDVPCTINGYRTYRWTNSPPNFHFEAKDSIIVAGGVALDIIENFTACFSRHNPTFSLEKTACAALSLGMSFCGGPYWSFWQSQDATRVYSDEEKHCIATDLIKTSGFPQHHIYSLFADQRAAVLQTLTASSLPLKPFTPKPMDTSGVLTEADFQIQPGEFPYTKGFKSFIQYPSRHRRFFISRNKFMGLGPKQLQGGDVIAHLFNCRLPVILRKVQSHYILIGAAYFHGWNGEKIKEGMEDGSLRKQNFEIH